MEFKKIKAVTIFGFANANPGDPLYQDTFEVSRVLAENGLEVVNGGGPGVMRAATEGAHAGNGLVTVATFHPKYIENFEGKDPENKADKEIVEENYMTRTMKLLELGNAYIVFNGGTGTLSEFGMAWGLAYLYFGHHKPMILYGEFWHEVTEVLVKNMKIGDRPGALRVYKIATTPDMVMKYLEEFEGRLDGEPDKQLVDSGSGETAFIN